MSGRTIRRDDDIVPGGSDGPDRVQLEVAIEAQERLRGVVDDSVIDAGVAALRAQLESLGSRPPRRSQATILFADVSGFTTMSERLDPEEVAGVMNALWEALDAVVRLHGGRVDKHIGDALMAVWGAEGVREEDPELGVRAALALQVAVSGFRARNGITLTMRVGVSTGLVLFGAVGSGSAEFTAMGDVVNVASRLEHAAPPGGVLIPHDTYRHVRGVFDVQAPTALVLKGKSEPVLTYLVERAKPRALRVATRGVEGVETHTIGRDAELNRLTAEFEMSVIERATRVVTIVGEAGIGKSRLLYEFHNRIELQPKKVFLFQGRATRGQERSALGLLRDVIATRFDILQSDDPTTVTAKLRMGFAPSLTDAEADVTGYWLRFALGESEATARIAGAADLGAVAMAHLFGWFADLTRDDPAVLLLEDIHWADDETIEVLEALARRDELPLLVVALARPTLFERRPDWARSAPRASRIVLGVLDEEVSRRLVREVLKHVDAVPERLVELVAGRADGNPYYVEELVKMLIDDGVVQVGMPGERWRIELDRLVESRIPATLSGVLQARLDSLPDEERRTLQRAAVVGRVFWDQAVDALAGTDVSHAALEAARRRELVHRRTPSIFASCSEFVFRHAMLRDVTYDTVLLRDRPTLHGRAARWIEAAAGARAGEYAEIVADHLELAGEDDEAAERLWRAGEAAADAGHHTAAARLLRRAFALWDAGGVDAPPQAHAVLGNALRIIGEFEAATAVFERAQVAVPSNSAWAAQLYCAASLLASQLGDREREGTLLAAARTCVAHEDLKTRSRVEIGTAWWHLLHGRNVEAEGAAFDGLRLAAEVGDQRGCAMAEAALSDVAGSRDDLDAALQHTEREQVYAVATGDLYAIANAQARLGLVRHLRGDAGADDEEYTRATLAYTAARDVFRRLGARHSFAYTGANLAQASLRMGDVAAAADQLRDALREAVAAGGPLATIYLQVEADRRMVAGDIAGGLALLGRLRRNRDYAAPDEEETHRILARFVLAEAQTEGLLAAGDDLDLDAVVEDILARADQTR